MALVFNSQLWRIVLVFGMLINVEIADTQPSTFFPEQGTEIISLLLTAFRLGFQIKHDSELTFCQIAISGLPLDVENHFMGFKELHVSAPHPRLVISASEEAVESASLQTSVGAKSDWSQSSRQTLRLSPQCYILVQVSMLPIHVGTQSLTEISENILGVRSREVVFLLVGFQSQVLQVINSSKIPTLTHKIAVFTDTREIYAPSYQFLYTDASKSMIGPYKGHQTGYGHLRGQHVRFGVLKVLPFVVFDANGSPVTGSAISAIEEAATRFNMTYSIKSELKPYSKLRNGTWQGMMGDLTEDRLDVICFMSRILSRNEGVDYTSYVRISSLSFYTSHPRTSLKWQAIFHPFDLTVWFSVLIILLISMPVFYLQLISANKEPVSGHRPFQWNAAYHAFSLPLAAILQESARIPSRVHFLGVCFVFYSMVLDTFYNSNLISHITLPEPDEAPRTFPDLALARDRYNITALGMKGGATATFFSTNTNQAIIQISEKLGYSLDIVNCITRPVTETRSACITYAYIAEAAIAGNLSIHPAWNPLMRSRDEVGMSVMCVAMQKNSKFYEFWNFFFGRVREAGLFATWEGRSQDQIRKNGLTWMRELQSRNSSLANSLTERLTEGAGNKEAPFNLQHLVFALSSILVGGAIASVSFVVELSSKYVVMTTANPYISASFVYEKCRKTFLE